MANKENEDLQEDIVEDNVNADEEVQETPDQTENGDSSDKEEKGDTLQDTVEALKQENSELKDQYLRKHADFENYRKRMAREKADSVKYGNQELLKDLIEVIDNFDRAIKSSADSQDFDSFKEGISMIEQQFTGMLESKWGLTKMNCTGSEYDPNSHEALMMEETPDIEVPTVLEDFQAGYTLHDRVLRPAKVKVGKPAAEKKAEAADAAE
ncbi:MAG: nucleotide exchange factor GrpE [Spirochaetales bacterium]|nr:nucleotide exchange factor GrpE [Spirochaetales bacterium]